jgi:predicted phosphodiesterase
LISYNGLIILFGGIHEITHEKNDTFLFNPADSTWCLVDSDTSHEIKDTKHETLSRDCSFEMQQR